MKITKYGIVVLTETQGIKIENWHVEREDSDPSDASDEQMLLETVIPWAQRKLNDAILQSLKRIAREKKIAQNPTSTAPLICPKHHEQMVLRVNAKLLWEWGCRSCAAESN